jgi:outer membrane protein OmpA-like peptidoglycan-associated protein
MSSDMPEPGGALAELRELLVGQELETLASVQARLADPAKRAEDLAQVLPAAIKAAKANSLRDSLEPLVENALYSAVRNHPQKLVDAIYPIMGPAIRTSIAASIREFAESLNQIVRKSFSFQSIRWRIEALITGRSFSDILLSRSLVYSVEQVFLIHRQSGLLLQHAAARGSVLKDADMISGMLTAIQDFLSDSFAEGGQELETVDAGRFKLWLTYGSKVLLVGAVNGTAPTDLRKTFRKALDQIEESLQKEINNFKQDDVSVFEPALPVLEQCLLHQSALEQGTGGKARLWPYLAVLALVIAALLGYQARQRGRWNRYFEALRQQPGIVVTGIEKEGSSYVITGLKDPAAPDPRGRTWGIPVDAGKVSFDLHPFLSLNTPFAAQRELDATKVYIAGRIIRFDTGSSKLAAGEADHIDDVTAAIKRLPGASVTITGRADETGSPETNAKLSMDRANRVAEALVVQGIDRSALRIVAAGNTQPLQRGSSEWALQVNRSVSFAVSGQ